MSKPRAIVLCGAVLACSCRIAQAQDLEPTNIVFNTPETYQLGHSPLNEPSARNKIRENAPSSFAVPMGAGGLNFSAGLKTEYVDNVFLTHDNTKDDFIIVPDVDASAFFPVGQFNAIALDVDVAYYEYLKNSQLNTGVPLINPNSEMVFNLISGDFRFRFSEKFSYQQNPAYETGGEFFNIYNTGLFKRYENRVGCLGTWDQHDLVVTAGYFHEDLWSATSVYNYIDHSSELFSSDAFLAVSPKLRIGAEAAGSINDFNHNTLLDTWRARVGPAARIVPSSFITIRLGVGYERIEYDSDQASAQGLSGFNSYYAYGNVEHQIDRFLSQSLTVSHDNQLGYNAGNLESTTVSYGINWNPRPRLIVSPFFSVYFYEESYGPNAPANLYHESFTYYYPGLNVRYQLGPHWRATASWYYRVKSSKINLDGYAQNQLSVGLVYQF